METTNRRVSGDQADRVEQTLGERHGITFEEWFFLKLKSSSSCKIIDELPCRPLKIDKFCYECFTCEASEEMFWE